MSAIEETDRSTASRFRLTLPAHTAHLQLVRVTVAALASDVLSVEEIEDVKVAVEELTAAAMAPTTGEPDVHLEFLVDTDSLTVCGRAVTRWRCPARHPRLSFDHPRCGM